MGYQKYLAQKENTKMVLSYGPCKYTYLSKILSVFNKIWVFLCFSVKNHTTKLTFHIQMVNGAPNLIDSYCCYEISIINVLVYNFIFFCEFGTKFDVLK